VRLFVDAAVDEDIQRDADLARRAVTLSKLEKFERLKGIVYPDDAELARRYGPINSVNDRSDCRLLFCLERRAADFLITRDIGLRRRARRVGLGDGVLSVEDAVVWLRQTFEPAAVELPYVVEREAYAVDKSDPLFDGLRAEIHRELSRGHFSQEVPASWQPACSAARLSGQLGIHWSPGSNTR
jgi:rRNA-processing protein FCF1